MLIAVSRIVKILTGNSRSESDLPLAPPGKMRQKLKGSIGPDQTSDENDEPKRGFILLLLFSPAGLSP
jgi:hypothetical protein